MATPTEEQPLDDSKTNTVRRSNRISVPTSSFSTPSKRKVKGKGNRKTNPYQRSGKRSSGASRRKRVGTALSPTLSTIMPSGIYGDSTSRSGLEKSHQLKEWDLHQCPWLSSIDFELCKGFTNLYDLAALFTQETVNCEQAKIQQGCHVTGCTESEMDTAVWILSVLKDVDAPLWGRYVTERNWLVAHSPNFSALISPMITSLCIVSDCLVQVLHGQTTVTTLIVEKHSGSEYLNTLARTVSNVVDMFRVLRARNPDLQTAHGLCFPKCGTPSMVTKVEVSFDVNRFMFTVECTPLELVDVAREVVDVLRASFDYLLPSSEIHPAKFFVRLGRGELQLLSTMLGIEDPLLQEPANSMVFYSGQAGGKIYYKLIIEIENMVDLIIKSQAQVPLLRHIVQLTALPIGHGLQMYKSPGLIEPLHPGEIILCLKNYLQLVADALTSFHDLGYAHLDVRIPNVCFATTTTAGVAGHLAVLIDLDRARPSCNVGPVPYEGEMYIKDVRWPHSRLDWKQLGILAYNIAYRSDGDSSCDQFVSTLRKGIWDDELFQESSLMRNYEYTVTEVISNRK